MKIEPKTVKGFFKVSKIGDSYYLLLDKGVRDVITLEKGKMLNAKIMEIETVTVTCPKCYSKFIDYETKEDRDCPKCGQVFHDDPKDREKCKEAKKP